MADSQCIIESCSRPRRKKGRDYCGAHYSRWYRTGDPQADDPISLPGRRLQIGLTYKDQTGYIKERTVAGWRRQHRVEMERSLGRLLLPSETVHHINGIRDDNRIENLELWSKNHPPGQRVADKVEWATQILALYAPERLTQPTLPMLLEAA